MSDERLKAADLAQLKAEAEAMPAPPYDPIGNALACFNAIKHVAMTIGQARKFAETGHDELKEASASLSPAPTDKLDAGDEAGLYACKNVRTNLPAFIEWDGKAIWLIACQGAIKAYDDYGSFRRLTYAAPRVGDDGQIDMDFVRGCKIPESNRSFQNQKYFPIVGGVYLQADACDGPKCWIWTLLIDGRKEIVNPSRGQVRLLCKALGIPSAPQPQEPGNGR